MTSWQQDQEKDRYYHMGYRASSIEDCPLDKRSLNFPLYRAWMCGYDDHQRHRERLAELVAVPYCRDPLHSPALKVA